jgi:hypothetical protein
MHDVMTEHARARRGERSIRQSDCDVFQDWADLENPVCGNAIQLSWSRHAQARALKAGVRPEQVRRCTRIVMVVADGRVVTLYRRSEPRMDGRGHPRKSLRAWGRN